MVPQELLKYFGVLAATWVSGDVGLELERVPTAAVIEVVDEAKHTFTRSDQVSLYRLLAHDRRSEVYSRLKGSLANDKHLNALRLLSEDGSPEVQEIAVDALRLSLQRANADERTRIATSFAMESGQGPRLVLARALSGNIPGEDDYLYVLAHDANSRVRLAAIESTRRMQQSRLEGAASRTGTLSSDVLASTTEIFETALHDPVKAIRKLARGGYVEAQKEFT